MERTSRRPYYSLWTENESDSLTKRSRGWLTRTSVPPLEAPLEMTSLSPQTRQLAGLFDNVQEQRTSDSLQSTLLQSRQAHDEPIHEDHINSSSYLERLRSLDEKIRRLRDVYATPRFYVRAGTTIREASDSRERWWRGWAHNDEPKETSNELGEISL